MRFDLRFASTLLSCVVLALLIAAVTTPFLAFEVTGPDIVAFIRSLSPMLENTPDAQLNQIAQMMFGINLADFERIDTYSIIGGVEQLWVQGNHVPAAIILIFSVIFPICKTLLGLVNLHVRFASTLNRLAFEFHRLSMIDVFVAAVTLLVISRSTGYTVTLQVGFYLFCLYFFCHYGLGSLIRRCNLNRG